MRLIFLIDGFNVYHSIKQALKDQVVVRAKWLDYQALCQSFLRDVFYFDRSCSIVDIYYFSALPTHIVDKGALSRHLIYIDALESIGTKVVLGNFKKKLVRCEYCKKLYTKHEEKETDINIAVYLLKLFIEDKCDTAVIISGDTDLIAAIRNAKEMFPDKKIIVGFPFKRRNNHFENIADFTFNITARRYEKHQLSDPIVLANGKKLYKPTQW